MAYVHLKKDLDAHAVDWERRPRTLRPRTSPSPSPLTAFARTWQAALASVRTDLDAFSDAEADALMLSGYRMMDEEFRCSIRGFPTADAPAGWRFLSLDKLMSEVP